MQLVLLPRRISLCSAHTCLKGLPVRPWDRVGTTSAPRFTVIGPARSRGVAAAVIYEVSPTQPGARRVRGSPGRPLARGRSRRRVSLSPQVSSSTFGCGIHGLGRRVSGPCLAGSLSVSGIGSTPTGRVLLCPQRNVLLQARSREEEKLCVAVNASCEEKHPGTHSGRRTP